MRSPVRLLLIAQLCLFACLLLCVLLIPHFLFESNEGGVSNYGTYAKTIIPYTLGFGVCGLLTLRAAVLYPGGNTVRRMLIILGILYLLVLCSTYPYKLDTLYDNLHQAVGTALVLYTVLLGAWLLVFKAHSVVTLMLFTAQLIGFLLAVCTFFGLIHVLFIAELLESTAFGALLVTVMEQITEVRHQPNC
jgi:hypothetical protein